MSEKHVEKALLTFLNSRGHIVWKNENQGTYDAKRGFYRAHKNQFKPKGVPDILGISKDGLFIAIEVKKPEIYFRIQKNMEKWIHKDAYREKIGTQIRHFLEQHYFMERIRMQGGVAGFASDIGHVQDMGL